MASRTKLRNPLRYIAACSLPLFLQTRSFCTLCLIHKAEEWVKSHLLFLIETQQGLLLDGFHHVYPSGPEDKAFLETQEDVRGFQPRVSTKRLLSLLMLTVIQGCHQPVPP